MEEKKLICINCPLGCRLTVTMDGETILGVSGNTCMRGDSYARRELTNPTRIVTSTVKVSRGREKMVSVKTREDIPKKKGFGVRAGIKGRNCKSAGSYW